MGAVDVRDMLCAQALAQVSRAIKALDTDAILEVICNGEDVRADLVTWATSLGHGIVANQLVGEEIQVRIRKTRA